jgi:hypothetical protein
MKAFLSSTFWDLRAERRAALQAILVFIDEPADFEHSGVDDGHSEMRGKMRT